MPMTTICCHRDSQCIAYSSLQNRRCWPSTTTPCRSLTPVMSWSWRCSTLALLSTQLTTHGHPLDWFRSYLSGRTQVFVAWNAAGHTDVWRAPRLQSWSSAVRTHNVLSTSFRRMVYITTCLRTPKGGSKTQNGRFPLKITLALKESLLQSCFMWKLSATKL